MYRRTLCALACAMTMAVMLIPAGTASASQGDLPSITNVTTNNGGAWPRELAVGDHLRGSDNNWAGGDGQMFGPYTYQWERCMGTYAFAYNGCSAIPGATSRDYTVTSDDVGPGFVRFCATLSGGPNDPTTCSGQWGMVLRTHNDTDRDGVYDYGDACPNVAANTADGCTPPANPATAPGAGSDSPTSTSVPSVATESPSTSIPSAPAQPAPNGTVASAAARLTVVTANRSRTLRVRFAKAAVIRGTLTGPNGRPIAGATLGVMVRRAATTAQFVEVAKVVTGSDGRFAYVSLPGASRVVRFAYRAFSDDATYADTSDVTVLVKGALTLSATKKRVSNKQSTVFRGTLRGKPVPASGVVVDLQVWFHKKWRTFATPRTNKKGVFRFKYRFTQGAAKWKFRARFRKDSLYPYELNYSKKVAVRVTR